MHEQKPPGRGAVKRLNHGDGSASSDTNTTVSSIVPSTGAFTVADKTTDQLANSRFDYVDLGINAGDGYDYIISCLLDLSTQPANESLVKIVFALCTGATSADSVSYGGIYYVATNPKGLRQRGLDLGESPGAAAVYANVRYCRTIFDVTGGQNSQLQVILLDSSWQVLANITGESANVDLGASDLGLARAVGMETAGAGAQACVVPGYYQVFRLHRGL